MSSALTIIYDGIANAIVTPVSIANPFSGQHIDTRGIWDTGATNSVITKKAATELGLKPISRAVVNGVHGSQEVNVYFVCIELNNGQITTNVCITECEELSADNSIGMLVGMDIVTLGDFCITNTEKRTAMSFVVPSRKRIDFVEEINGWQRLNKIHQSYKQVGNDKCPCGSGKLWKNCHGKEPTP